MSRRRAKQHTEEGVNFFIPMVDLMVSAIFVFIIIVMVLVLMIQIPTESDTPSEDPQAAAAKGSETPVKPSIIENVVANQTASEILAKDIIKNILKNDGVDGEFDADKNTLRMKISKPVDDKELVK